MYEWQKEDSQEEERKNTAQYSQICCVAED